jgi:hypothetical protein
MMFSGPPGGFADQSASKACAALAIVDVQVLHINTHLAFPAGIAVEIQS